MIRSLPLFVVTLLCMQFQNVLGQDQRTQFINLEAGVGGVFTEVPQHSYIRGQTAYNSGVSGEVISSGTTTFFGAAFEMKPSASKVSYSSGLRYRRIDSKLKKNLDEMTGDYFYFQYNQTETAVDYLRVKEISQASDYLGITADVRWFPFNRHRFTFYFRGGVELDCLLKAKSDVDFVNNSMNQFKDEVSSQIKAPSSVTGILHLDAGIEIGKNSKFPIRIETGPTIFLSDNSPGLVRTIAGFEFMASFQIPF